MGMEKKNIAAVQCQLENKVLCGPGPHRGEGLRRGPYQRSILRLRLSGWSYTENKIKYC